MLLTVFSAVYLFEMKSMGNYGVLMNLNQVI